MPSFSEQLSQLRRWQHLDDSERRNVCLSIIQHFDGTTPVISEIANLAQGLAESGKIWHWPVEIAPRCDAPSTGGAGSLSTLVCPYIIAASGCFVPKVSVPGSIAGAIDVLGLLDGFRDRLSSDQMLQALRSAHIAHSLNTGEMAPADGVLFQYRSELGKKSVAPLVIASLLSKKIAVSCSSSVFDVRITSTGNLGSIAEAAIRNSQLFVDVAAHLGFTTTCVITDLSTPRISRFGRSESLYLLHHVLSAAGWHDVAPTATRHLKTCISIAGEGLLAAGISKSVDQGKELAESIVFCGAALKSLYEHLEAQGVKKDALHQHLDALQESVTIEVVSDQTGYLEKFDLEAIGSLLRTQNNLSAGRGDRLGIALLKQPGETIKLGEIVLTLRVRDVPRADEAELIRLGLTLFSVCGEVPYAHKSEEVVAVIRGPRVENPDA